MSPSVDINDRADAQASSDAEKPAMKVAENKHNGSEGEGLTQPQQHVHAATFMALFAICLIYFAQTFVLVGTGAQGHTIAAYLGRPGDAVWATASLTIPSVVLGPIVAQMADFWSRKWFLVASSLFGIAGCVIASRATSFATFIAGMAMAGIEFSVLPLLHAIPSEILPRRWRAPAQAAVMVANSLGLIVGLVLGGVFGRHGRLEGFRNYYYINAGLFVAGTVLCVFGYRPPPTELQTSLGAREKLAKLDWIGYVLLASSLVLFCMGLAWSDNPYEWSDPHTSATFAVGLALGIALVVYETKFKSDGMFHHGLFRGKDWNFAICIASVFCEGIAFFAAAVYFPLQIGFLYEHDPLLVGVRFSIAFVATIPASVATGLYCTLAKKIRWVSVLSFLIFVVFFACMATTDETTDSHTWGYPVFLGSALGMALIALVTMAQFATPPELISIASGLMISIRSLGGTVGIAIYNAVFIDEVRHAGDRVAEAAMGAGLPVTSVDQFVGYVLSHNETGIRQVADVSPRIIEAGIRALSGTYVKGFQHVWITSTAFVAAGVIATVFLTDPTSEFNNRIDAPIGKGEGLYGGQDR